MKSISDAFRRHMELQRIAERHRHWEAEQRAINELRAMPVWGRFFAWLFR